MKTMSIIGIVWFTLSLFCLIGFYETDLEASSGWGMLGMLYAIPFAIVVLVKSNYPNSTSHPVSQELIQLAELRDKGILTEDEFKVRKFNLLNT